MSKNVAYTADFDIRADFTVPLFMSSDPDGINAPIDWTYCPNCGYRIVETSSGEDNNSER